MGLYHFQIGFPKGFNSNVGTVPLKWGIHATQAASSDRYGVVPLLGTLNTGRAQCIEVELIDGAVTKLVYRVPHNDTLDLVLVVSPRGGAFFVRTVWLNLKADQHTTLDVSRYEAA